MTRDDKGRFVKDGSEETTTENANAVVSYGYYSKLLNKPFDTVEELQAAEEEFKTAELEKKQKAELKKADASKVEEAYKHMNEVRTAYSEKAAEARKIYDEAVAAAYDDLKNELGRLDAEVSEAEAAFNKSIDEFREKNGSDFHMTFKDGDRVVSIQRTGTMPMPMVNFNYDFDDMWKRMYNLLRF